MNYAPILANFNITELNTMQKASMELILQPKDLLLISPTGSGKTLAFLLPVLQLLDKEKKGVQVLIIVPTRELAIQIEQVFKQMGSGYKINCCYGGHSVRIEENNLQDPPAVLVGTPGRLAHHLRKKNLLPDSIHTLILDEFDKSLEFGFKEDMAFIAQNTKFIRKRILTSATELKEIPRFVGVRNLEELNYSSSQPQVSAALSVKVVSIEGDDKLEALMLLLGKLGSQTTLVFCNHRDAVSRISEQLARYKVQHGFYHGGLDQIEREKTLIKLRNGSIRILITTDLAARGLDIPEIEAIIHYQFPATEDVMIHRNGRTARMHAGGTAYFLLGPEEHLPPFLTLQPEAEALPKKLELPKPSPWKTLYISAGKKDKINKMDIVGMLLQKGNLKKEELGKIEVLDHSAYVAVNAHKITQTLQLIQNQKIKNKKVKVEIST